MKSSFSDILKHLRAENESSLREKLPEWSEYQGISIPSHLALEQCSGQDAARRKARLAQPGWRIADLTGGLGVDSWAFAVRGCEVLYFERNPELCEAALKNFGILGVSDRITVECREMTPEGIDSLPDLDMIFLDPARRSSAGRKVFLLEDCSPDLTLMLDGIWKKTPRLLVKLSPMADISMLRDRFRGTLETVSIVCVGGEVKELLCSARQGGDRSFSISVENGEYSFSFTAVEEEEAVAEYATGALPGQYLFVPGPGLMKAGAFKLTGARHAMKKLAPSTQMYLCDRPVDALIPFGKFHLIREVLPFGKDGFRRIRTEYPRAEVTARNIPMSSEELGKRMGVKSGAGAHVYGTLIGSSRVLIVV